MRKSGFWRLLEVMGVVKLSRLMSLGWRYRFRYLETEASSSDEATPSSMTPRKESSLRS